jgi:hypothetical protein
LELPLTLVPQFEEHFSEPGLWQDSWFHFLAGYGVFARQHHVDECWDFPYLAIGRSPRSIGSPWPFDHCVVYQRGELIHDPHRSGAGVIKPWNFTTLERITDFSEFAMHDLFDRALKTPSPSFVPGEMP